MGNRGQFAAGLCLLLAVTACSSGSGKVLVQGSQAPPLATTSASATTAPSATPSSPAARAKGHSTAPTTAATTTSSAPRSTATTAPQPKPSKTATRISACTTQGPTTTVQMVAPYRFSPSTVSINRCDAVKAVYADSSGAPHNWKGPGWSSPDMSSSGQSYTYRFTSTGTFNFYCSYHQGLGMTGTVTVR